ncbi:hypothetical protein NCS57_01396800 [Fusarium keratoplasticum]|uniref:Uncharacterized protein n=1 Tax=Fusarium keratoplasticum TaxID=1328300 RepID=A0ACC0QG71_9HYPO|nr:hypothetical protein NCS57_01396800 [Fusarium keratoplasticum]KAI8650624.1 hypothetical protein NCS57_01396800 [Fusarium keratoplasticum]
MATETTTTASEVRQLRLDAATSRLLEDYEIHHFSSPANRQRDGEPGTVIVAGNIRREAQPSDFDSTLAPHPPVPYPVSNPEWWPGNFRNIPEYRPVNRNLDWDERRQSPLFTIVGGVMVWGCCFMANWAQLWRNTAGRATDIGLSKVGGEW